MWWWWHGSGGDGIGGGGCGAPYFKTVSWHHLEEQRKSREKWNALFTMDIS